MNSISGYQLGAMLVIADVFGLFCTGGNISLMTLYGALAAAAFQFLFALIFIIHGGGSSRLKKLIFAVYTLFSGGVVFSSLWRTHEVIYIPYEDGSGIWGRVLTAGLIAAVCIYGSSTGIRAVSRAAVIIAAAGALCILIDFSSAAFNAEWENISRPEMSGFVYEFMRGNALSGGIGSFFVLLDKTKGERFRTALVYFGARAVLTAVVLLTALSVAGGIVTVTDFPVITAAQLSQPFEAQRIDSLFLVVFIAFAVFSVTLHIMTAAHILKELFPGFLRYRSSTAAAAVIGTALLISGRELILLRAAAAIGVLIIAEIKRSAVNVSG